MMMMMIIGMNIYHGYTVIHSYHDSVFFSIINCCDSLYVELFINQRYKLSKVYIVWYIHISIGQFIIDYPINCDCYYYFK